MNCFSSSGFHTKIRRFGLGLVGIKVWSTSSEAANSGALGYSVSVYLLRAVVVARHRLSRSAKAKSWHQVGQSLLAAATAAFLFAAGVVIVLVEVVFGFFFQCFGNGLLQGELSR